MPEWLDENEEMERFTKALGKCRTCNHIMIAHPSEGNKLSTCMEANPMSKVGKYTRCPCKLFVPKDNLEFLEWAAARKQKGK